MALESSLDDAIVQLRTSIMRLSRRLRQERLDDQLTPSQLAVLGDLVAHGTLTPGELAQMEHVRPPSMSRILAALESDGFVLRQPHPEDGRQSLISLTDKARDWIDTYRAARDRWLRAQLEQFDANEQQLLRAAIPLLEQLAEAPSPH